jgi:hypothetical protein
MIYILEKKHLIPNFIFWDSSWIPNFLRIEINILIYFFRFYLHETIF